MRTKIKGKFRKVSIKNKKEKFNSQYGYLDSWGYDIVEFDKNNFIPIANIRNTDNDDLDQGNKIISFPHEFVKMLDSPEKYECDHIEFSPTGSSKTQQGYFHDWVLFGQIDDESDRKNKKWALIEDKDGFIHMISKSKVKFLK